MIDATATADSGALAEHCAGVLILLERLERPHQMMRIFHRLGVYDPDKLDMAAPVVESRADCKRKA